MPANQDAAFRALADPTRRAILRMLAEAALTSGEIAAQFESTWATISRHLAVLREAKLVSAERDGNSIVYSLNTDVVNEIAAHMRSWTSIT